MNTQQKKQAAAKKLARRRGISESAAMAEINTSGLDAVLAAIGGVSSSDYSSSDGGSSSYSSSDGGGSYSSGE